MSISEIYYVFLRRQFMEKFTNIGNKLCIEVILAQS